MMYLLLISDVNNEETVAALIIAQLRIFIYLAGTLVQRLSSSLYLNYYFVVEVSCDHLCL